MLRAVQAGALGVLIAHPLTFLLPSMAGAGPGGIDGLAGVLLVSAWSYLLVGWLTFPVGVVLGITGAWVLQRHERRRSAAGSDPGG
jgi:ABC-type sulfate transport system permease subunit